MKVNRGVGYYIADASLTKTPVLAIGDWNFHFDVTNERCVDDESTPPALRELSGDYPMARVPFVSTRSRARPCVGC